MIKFTNNAYEFCNLKATFTDNGEPRTEYGDDHFYWENLVGKWGHLNNLHIEQVSPTEDQTARLVVLNELTADRKDIYPAECTAFVEHGMVIVDDEGCPFLQPLAEEYKDSTLSYFRELKRQELQAERESRIGAPINNVQVSRLEDREKIKDALANWEILLKNPDGTKNWVMADNSVSPLKLEDLQVVRDVYAHRVDTCFAAYEDALVAARQAQTVEEILSVEMTIND